MSIGYVIPQCSPGLELKIAQFTCVHKRVWKMNILHVVSCKCLVWVWLVAKIADKNVGVALFLGSYIS